MNRWKIVFGAALICTVAGTVLFTQREHAEAWLKPLLMGSAEEFDAEEMAAKNRPWSAEEAAAAQAEYEAIRGSMPPPMPDGAGGSGINTYAGGALGGQWICRGPYNMPGAFEFTEMDDGTDTVYGVTCGHYGGVQFIWKGTLTDDKWVMINPKNPSRFSDLRIIPNGTHRRILAGHQNGGIMYSDDGGANWTNATGFPGALKSMVVNNSDSWTVYAADGSSIYRSTDKGATFSVFQNTGSTTNARLYVVRFATQPNAGDVYFAKDGYFYKLNSGKTSFDQIGTIPTGGVIGIAGDSRRLWVTIGNKWHYSTNGGASFTYQPTESWWYSDAGTDMNVGHYPGVSPANPLHLIGGYSIPQISQDGGITMNSDSKSWWGYYQNSVGNDPKVRIHYHPDFQGNQFFYDKAGNLLTLRASDGGIIRSYNEWTKTSFPTLASIEDVYYNISLFGCPSQESYRGGFIYGAKSKDHLTSGTQDQGWQDVRATTYGNDMLSWDQIGGGDGPCCITGDGLIGWSYNYQGTGSFKRFSLYNGNTYTGQTGTKSASTDFSFTGSSYFTPSVGDWANGDRIWVLSQTLRRITYANGTTTALEKDFTSATSYIQGVAQSHKNADIVYAMEDGTVFKSTDRGTSWSQVASKTATGMSGSGQNRGMGWGSPLDDNILLFASQSGTAVKTIFSKDGGITWKNVTGTGANLFPNAEVNGMAGNSDGRFVFASTNKGPYVFVVADEAWYPLATDADVPIFWGQACYCVKYGTTEIVHFATWGQGIWDFVIDDNAPKLAVTAPTGSTYSIGNTLHVGWTTNQTGSVTVDLMSGTTKVKTLGTADAAGSFDWAIDNSAGYGSDYSIRLTLGTLTASSGAFSIMPHLTAIPQRLITLSTYNSQNSTSEAASNTLDGDTTSIWHTSYASGAPGYPHSVVYQLDPTKIIVNNLLAFSYVPRMDGSENGMVIEYELQVSADGSSWKAAKSGQLSGTAAPELVLFDQSQIGTDAVYVRFLANSEKNGNIWASMAEFNLYCDQYDTIATGSGKLQGGIRALGVTAINRSLRIALPAADNVTVALFEMNGRKVFEKSLSLPAGMSTINLDKNVLSSQQYLARVAGAKGSISTKIILK